jgi:hypothetical protein
MRSVLRGWKISIFLSITVETAVARSSDTSPFMRIGVETAHNYFFRPFFDIVASRTITTTITRTITSTSPQRRASHHVTISCYCSH